MQLLLPLPDPTALHWLYRNRSINLHLMDELSILEERIQDKIAETKFKMDN
jgi:hypothetical protein